MVNLTIRKIMAGTILAASCFLAWRGKLRESLCVVALIYLTSQGRSHEYHLTLYVPLLAFLYTREDGAYRTRWMVVLIWLAACPTVFPMFKWLYEFSELVPSSAQMLQANPGLYWIWLVQKPILSLLVFGTIVKRECLTKISRTS